MIDSELTSLSIAELSAGLNNKKFSAEEVTKAYIKKMEEGRKYNAFITESFELALNQAKQSDKRISEGRRLSDLDGIPLGIKDLFCTKGLRTTAASKMLENFIPPYESSITCNLLKAGSIFIGKTNLDEFAMGGANLTSYFGQVINPTLRSDGKQVVSGGSSGGSAVAVKANMCAAATGTDTGGSIRQPAAFCGIVGIKPTYGRCSRYGIIAYASSLDQAGPMTKTVEDATIMLEKMAGFDALDSTSINIPVPSYKTTFKKGIKGLKIGIPKEFLTDSLNKEIFDTWMESKEILEKAGAIVKEITLPSMKYALATYYIIAPAEASSNLARYDGVKYGLRVEGATLDEMYENTRGTGFGEEVKRRIMIGTYVLSAGYYDAYYLKASKVRRLIRHDYLNAFKDVDMILTPVAPTTAFTIEESKAFDPVTNYLQDAFTVPINLAKLPAISVPIKLSSNGLPIGMQLIGRDFDEETLFQGAYVLEQK